jgi:repressor LexA
VYYDGSTITLVPANSAYRPKSYSGPELDDIQIEGKATGYTHWF